MLNDIPVREEIREFLFKVWAEVLALAALRYGAQDQQTVTLKRTAADLVWAASAKPNRNDRARVIQDLPNLLQRLPPLHSYFERESSAHCVAKSSPNSRIPPVL